MAVNGKEAILKDLRIVWSNNLPEPTRKENNIPDNTFVEVRIEKNSPPVAKFVLINGSPITSIRSSFKRAGLLGIKF